MVSKTHLKHPAKLLLYDILQYVVIMLVYIILTLGFWNEHTDDVCVFQSIRLFLIPTNIIEQWIFYHIFKISVSQINHVAS